MAGTRKADQLIDASARRPPTTAAPAALPLLGALRPALPLLLLALAALPLLWWSLTVAPALLVDVGQWGDHSYLSGVSGIEQSSTFQQDLSFVLHSMAIRFHAAARLDDVLEASCILTEAKAASLHFRQEVNNSQGGQLYCSADVVVACIRLSSQRPCRVPQELLQKLRAV